MATQDAAASYDSKREAESTGPSFVKMWLDALQRAETEEKEWCKKAEETSEIYRGKKKTRARNFNILHANVEVICSAVYNSTPVPDVRRRFSDADPVGGDVAELLERALSFAVDTYDFDNVMKFVVHDGEVVGRGVPRVRYVPTFGPLVGPDGTPVMNEAGQPEEEVVYEEVTCEYVPWRMFRRGPARSWNDVPWVAFGDFLTREELEKLVGEAENEHGNRIIDQIPMNYTADERDGYKKLGKEEQSIFRRCLVWQIWDRDSRRVISIAPEYGASALRIIDDPLGLSGFFPTPRPYQPVLVTDTLTPVPPYEIYEDLVLELNEITGRIVKLVKQLRPRGGYGGGVHDIKAIAEADDGELVPLNTVDMLLQAGGVEKAITWFPLDPTIKALAQLVDQRERVKQTIYEVTGIADILRGSTSPSETLGAQQLKAQWGSLRIQDRQKDAARVARDLFRLKAEIMANKFSVRTLSLMTGVDVTPEMEQLLRSETAREYRIDIESDSTIRGDLARNQQTMANFLTGTAQYASAMGPIIMQFPEMMQPAMQIYASFARQFNLGKQAEDALDSLTKTAMQAQQPGPDAAGQAQQQAADMERERADAEIEERRARLEMEREEKQARLEIDREKLAIERLTKGVPEEALAAAMANQPNVTEKIDAMMAAVAGLSDAMRGVVEAQNAPRELIKDQRGRPVAVRSGNTVREVVYDFDGSVAGLQ